ncbi:unnamed protein product [Oreochromis niloticus]|nr:unnamed protein product [Mustela putorius furo]
MSGGRRVAGGQLSLGSESFPPHLNTAVPTRLHRPLSTARWLQDDGNVPILVSPVHPVTEGASVSLSCSLKTQKILSNVFFYHNDKLIQNDTRGELKISAVSKSDEGFYKCQYSGRESAQSWMSVKVTASGADSSSSPVWLMVGLVCGVSLIIILLLLLYRCRQSKYSCFTRSIQSESHSPGSSTNHGVNQDETHVYDSLHHGTADVYESVTQVKNRNDICMKVKPGDFLLHTDTESVCTF